MNSQLVKITRSAAGKFLSGCTLCATAVIAAALPTHASPPLVIISNPQGSGFPLIPGFTTCTDFAIANGDTRNLVAIGQACDSAAADPKFSQALAFLETSNAPQLVHNFDLMSPEGAASMYNANRSGASAQSGTVGLHLEGVRAGIYNLATPGLSDNDDERTPGNGLAGPSGPSGASAPPPPENRFGFFFNGIGEFVDVGNTANAQGYNSSAGGYVLGGDYIVSPNFVVGLLTGYAHTSTALPFGGDLQADGVKLGVYGSVFTGGFYTDFGAIGGLSSYDSTRASLDGNANGSATGDDIGAFVQTGYDWKFGAFKVGPIASFKYTYTEVNSYTEDGSLTPLKFPHEETDSSLSALGAKSSYEMKVGSFHITPELRLEWQHEYGETEYPVAAQFASGAGDPFTVYSPKIGRDSLLIGAGSAFQLSDRVSFYLYYDGEVAQTNYISSNVTAGVRVQF